MTLENILRAGRDGNPTVKQFKEWDDISALYNFILNKIKKKKTVAL